jgi:hypothetical protein
MAELREDLGIGLINPQSGFAQGMEAKTRISKLLDIEINNTSCPILFVHVLIWNTLKS